MLDSSIFDQYLETIASAPACYVGFSGGLDSTVLLHLVAAWYAGQSHLPPLRAIHINHGMQAESDHWQAHCQSVCDALDVPLQVCAVDVVAAGGGESGARRARYDVFEHCINESSGGVLLLAHHRDDQVETFFLRLMRGAGLEGLSAIPVQRSIGKGVLIRPLLDTPRLELEAFAEQCELEYVEDPSNADSGMDRNFLRNEVLPMLEGRWPAYRETVSRASAHIAEASSALAAGLGGLNKLRSVTGDPGLALDELRRRPPEDARRVLRFWLRERGVLVPDESLLSEFVRQLADASAHSNPKLETGSYAITRFGEGIYLHAPAADVSEFEEVELTPGQSREIAGVGRLSLRASEESGVRLSSSEIVQVRLRAGGERCRVAGRGHSTSLKNVLQELSVPPWWRERIPLIYLGEELLAVGDLLLCKAAPSDEGEKEEKMLWAPIWQRESPPFD